MNVENTADSKIMRYGPIHLSFVLSAIGMAWIDQMNRHSAA